MSEMRLSVHDVAAYIELQLGRQPAYKLQKLVYYAQAWSLAWTGATLFETEFQAWKNGPVSPELWQEHLLPEPSGLGRPHLLASDEVAILSAVIDFYGAMSVTEMIALSRRETPWRQARRGLGPTDPGETVIEPDSMRDYYSRLSAPGEKRIPESLRLEIARLLAKPENELDTD
jgi:uncharacterized phage-associated protein